MNNEPKVPHLSLWLCCVLLISGTAVCLHYGRLAYMPLDQSGIFDGAWRVLSGQVPFRDFTLTTGLVPILIQVPFFQLLGVTWFAYCLHAALFNGLFCLLTYAFLRSCALPRGLSFFYALLSGISFYPPTGTPYMEQHGFFLLLGTILLLTKSRSQKGGSLQYSSLIFLPALFLLIYLSKPNVALVGTVPLLLFFLLPVRNPRDYGRMIGFVVCGVFLCLLAGLLVLFLYNLDFYRIKHYLFDVPMAVGQKRLPNLRWVNLRISVLSPWIVLLTAATSVIVGFLQPGAGTSSRRIVPGKVTLDLILAASLVTCCMLFVEITKNHPANGFPFLFLAVGMVHSCARASAVSPLLSKPILGWVSVFLILVSLRDAAYFHAVNFRRSVHDNVYHTRSVEKLRTPELSYMAYLLPRRLRHFRASDLDNVVDFLRSRPENFFLFGDMSILYGVTGKPSVNPSLLFHSQITSPLVRSDYEKELIESLGRYKVRYIVVEGNHTWTEAKISDFPALEGLIRCRTREVHHFGAFKVLELADLPSDPAQSFEDQAVSED